MGYLLFVDDRLRQSAPIYEAAPMCLVEDRNAFSAREQLSRSVRAATGPDVC
jgi:hypothetical protein